MRLLFVVLNLNFIFCVFPAATWHRLATRLAVFCVLCMNTVW